MGINNQRMSQQLNTPSASTPNSKSHKSRISQHLLANNLHLIATMTQRDQLNRELIRLSFLSNQAMSKNKQEELKENDHEDSESSISPDPSSYKTKEDQTKNTSLTKANSVEVATKKINKLDVRVDSVEDHK